LRLSKLTRASELKVGGLTPFSATDYPGQLASVVFVQGCPWRCGYCHNPHLQPRTADSPLAWDDVRRHLRRRVGLVDAVVFSGGEPTMAPALEDAIHEARALGFRIGLHTAGIYPRRLAEVLPLVDWVGLDVKALPQQYDAVTRVNGSSEPVRASLDAVLGSGVAHEVRTTLHPGVHTAASLLTLATELSALGVQRYVVQQFRAIGCADDALTQAVPTEVLDEDLLTRLRSLFAQFEWRQA
jgi:anaerobic ribonucleoside-triphosphate reductase activating protein